MIPNEILAEIEEKESQITELKKQYFDEVEPCHNVKCCCYKQEYHRSGRCGWTDAITKCDDYIPEEE